MVGQPREPQQDPSLPGNLAIDYAWPSIQRMEGHEWARRGGQPICPHCHGHLQWADQIGELNDPWTIEQIEEDPTIWWECSPRLFHCHDYRNQKPFRFLSFGSQAHMRWDHGNQGIH